MSVLDDEERWDVLLLILLFLLTSCPDSLLGQFDEMSL